MTRLLTVFAPQTVNTCVRNSGYNAVGQANVVRSWVESTLKDMTFVPWSIYEKRSQIYVNLKFHVVSNVNADHQHQDISRINRLHINVLVTPK